MSGEVHGLLFAALNLAVAAAAMLIDRLWGYPQALFSIIRHPVTWMGALIGWFEGLFNPAAADAGRARLNGGLMLIFLTVAVLLVTVPLALLLRVLPWGWALEAALASSLLSQHGLERAVRNVADGLGIGIGEARKAVGHVVGRDTSKLDEAGVSRGALESLAENMSDGVTAPLIWLLAAGLPGAAVYKAINTADSMVGYTSDRHRDFGRASAKLDDFVNLPASRLTGLLIALGASLRSFKDGAAAFRTMRRDAGKHVSPNAGWPEAAMAGALRIRLGGPRSYEKRKVDLPWMGDGREDIGRGDIIAGLGLYNRALNILTGIVVLGWLVSVLA